MSLRELETFLKWLQEAETTVNVLADASQREDLSQDTAHVKELRRQLEVGERAHADYLTSGSSETHQRILALIEARPGRGRAFLFVHYLLVRIPWM